MPDVSLLFFADTVLPQVTVSHIATIAELQPGVVSVKAGGETKKFFVSSTSALLN